jgi:hypothetical protein
MKNLIYFSLLAAMLLAACGAPATPTMSPADVQATAFSSASTMVALTEAAIPTATPLPPTSTPTATLAVTNTIQAPPTSATLSLPPTLAPTKPAGGTDTCIKPLNLGEAGPTSPVVIHNESGGSLNLSLNLWKPNAFGQCGALSYSNVAKGATISVQLPGGSWFAYAWISLKGGSSEASGSFVIQQGFEEKQNLIIDKDVITLRP